MLSAGREMDTGRCWLVGWWVGHLQQVTKWHLDDYKETELAEKISRW